MENVVKRAIKLYFNIFFALLFGNCYLLKTLMKIFKKEIKISIIIKYSAIIEIIFYLIMLITLYTIPSFFNLLFYGFFLLIAYYINLFFSSLIYYIVNFLGIKLNKYTNLFLFIGIGTLITSIGMINENRLLYEKVQIKCNNLKGSIKIAHLSDLHLGAIYGKKFVQKIVDYIKEENKIDFIVITGDLEDGNIKMTSEMLEPFSQLNIPKYYVTGNHESFCSLNEVFKTINNSSITHLYNENIIFDNKINIIGIDYDSNYDLIKNKLKSLIPKNNYSNIFIHHIPIFEAKELSEYNIFLFLCGHTHGGQLFPMNILHYFVSKVYKGLYNYNNSNYIYVASGVGTSGPPIRTMSRALIGIINLEGNM